MKKTIGDIQVDAINRGYKKGQEDLLNEMMVDVMDCCPCARQRADIEWLRDKAQQKSITLKQNT